MPSPGSPLEQAVSVAVSGSGTRLGELHGRGRAHRGQSNKWADSLFALGHSGTWLLEGELALKSGCATAPWVIEGYVVEYKEIIMKETVSQDLTFELQKGKI